MNVVESVEDLVGAAGHLLHIQAQRVDWRALPEKVEPQKVHRVFAQRLKPVHDIPEALAHLPPLPIEDVTLEEEGPVGSDGFPAQNHVQDQKGVCPSPRLVYTLGEELCRDEPPVLLVREGGVRGGTAVVPRVEYERFPVHRRGTLRALEGYLVDPRAMKLEVSSIRKVGRQLQDPPPREGGRLLSALRADPDRERRPPYPLPRYPPGR